MMRTAVRLWGGVLATLATAFVGAVLLLTGPAAAAPTTSGGTTADYGPATAPSTLVTTTTAPPVTKPAAIAFTGADIALMVTIGAAAVGVGGTLVLVSRRRRAEAEGR
jgi:hypothetical protein